jgi:4-hydroxy-tetrahydrodipicolinate synthase
MTNLPFKGVIPPLVTPLSDRDALDVEGLERLVPHVLGGGVHGLFILGTTGEGPSLSAALQRDMVQRCAQLVGSRAPLLVGVTHTSVAESLALARHAAESGADAVVLAAPCYFPMSQSDLQRVVAGFAAESPLPVMLYNMPSHTKVAFSQETVRQLMLECPNVVGIKDSSGQMMYFQQLVQLARERPGFTVLMGPEELLAPSVLLGGDGGVCGGANLAPRLYVELYEAALTGDLRRTHRLQQQVLRLSSRLYEVGPPPNGYLTGLKSALQRCGLCRDRLAEPLYQMDAAAQARLEQHLLDLGLATRQTPAANG